MFETFDAVVRNRLQLRTRVFQKATPGKLPRTSKRVEAE